VLTWLLADQQNTVNAQLVDSSGALTVRQQDPFGQSRTGAAVAWGDGHGFLNAATSTVTGLSQLGARLYDPTVGKFLSVDAVLSPFNPVQNNGYSYAGNSPIGRSDPSGNYYVGGSLGDCSDRGCSGSSAASGGISGPAAPGKAPSYGAVSPHVFVDSGSFKKAESAYEAGRKEYGFKPGDAFISEEQEMSLWFNICNESRSCPDSLKLLLMTQGFAPSDNGLSIQGMVIGGGAFFFINTPSAGGGSDEGDSVVRDFADPESMVGATFEEVQSMIPEGWVEQPMSKGQGVRWGSPATRNQPVGAKGYVEFSEGAPGTDERIHQGGRYTRVSSGGTEYWAAAHGNTEIRDGVSGVTMGKSNGPIYPDLSGPRIMPRGAGGSAGE